MSIKVLDLGEKSWKSPGICLKVLEKSWNKASQSPGKTRKMSWKVLESPGIWNMFFCGNPAVPNLQQLYMRSRQSRDVIGFVSNQLPVQKVVPTFCFPHDKPMCSKCMDHVMFFCVSTKTVVSWIFMVLVLNRCPYAPLI